MNIKKYFKDKGNLWFQEFPRISDKFDLLFLNPQNYDQMGIQKHKAWVVDKTQSQPAWITVLFQDSHKEEKVKDFFVLH